LKILVPIKRVPDPDTRIRIKADGSGIDFDGVKFAVNPFDAIALEEALRIKERTGEVEVVVVSIGTDASVEQLRFGLAMGADRALLVKCAEGLDSLAVAKVLAAIYSREKPDFVLMGKQAIDDDSNQTGQMLSALLGIGQTTFVSKLEMLEGNRKARCGRNRWRHRDCDRHAARGDHQRPAIERTTLCITARDHESEKETAERSWDGRPGHHGGCADEGFEI